MEDMKAVCERVRRVIRGESIPAVYGPKNSTTRFEEDKRFIVTAAIDRELGPAPESDIAP